MRLNDCRSHLVKTDSELEASRKRIEELEHQLKEPIEVVAAQVIEKVPEEVEKELNELRAKAAQPIDTSSIRFKIQFDSWGKGFGDLLRALGEIDTEAQRKI